MQRCSATLRGPDEKAQHLHVHEYFEKSKKSRRKRTVQMDRVKRHRACACAI